MNAKEYLELEGIWSGGRTWDDKNGKALELHTILEEYVNQCQLSGVADARLWKWIDDQIVFEEKIAKEYKKSETEDESGYEWMSTIHFQKSVTLQKVKQQMKRPAGLGRKEVVMDKYNKRLIKWVKDHYWDSLEKDKDLILRHLKTFTGDS